jgi:hypothetical protein
MSRKATIRVMWINVIAFIVLVVLLEGVLRVAEYVTRRPALEQSYGTDSQPSYFVPDVALGYRGPSRGGSYRVVSELGRDTTYDVTYTLLPGGWRSVSQHVPDSASRFVAFFGCSFTFGEGVPDSTTLPAAFAATTRDSVHVYNRGFHGWGPQGMLALLEAPPYALGVRQKAGIAIFTTIDEHLARLRGDYYVVSDWGPHLPYYVRGPNGVPTRSGDFTSGRPLYRIAYGIARRSRVLSRLLVGATRPGSPEDWSFMADVFQRSCTLFAQRFESHGCYILVWPTMASEHRELVPRLLARGVGVLDYSSLWTVADSLRYQIPKDGHPSPEAYRVVAARLAADLAGRVGR